MSPGPIAFQRALKWSYVMTWGEQAFTTLIAFVLAALLGPGAFGLMAIALAYVLFSQTVLEQGLVVAVIQREKLQATHLNAVFWIVMSASIVQVALSIALGEWWAGVTGLPQLASVIAVLSLTIPIRAMTVVQKALLQREMDFKGLALRTNVSVLVGGVVALAMALTGYGVWALVGQRLVTDATGLIVLWTVSPWRPRFAFSARACRDLLGFSLANCAASMGVFVQHHADAFLMGALFGPVPVGIYRLSMRLISTVVQLTIVPLRAVALARFSRLQNDRPALEQAVIDSLRLSVLTTIPALTILAIAADSLTALMGPRWAAAANVIRVLAVFGACMAFAYFSAPVLQALGRPHLLAASMWAHGLLWCASLFAVGSTLREEPLEMQVLTVAAARVGVAMVLSMPILLLILTRLCAIPAARLMRAVAPPFYAAGASIIAAILLANTGMVDGFGPRTQLIAETTIAVVAGAIVILATDREVRRLAAALVANAWTKPRALRLNS